MSADGSAAYPGEDATPKIGGFGTIPIQLPEQTTVHRDGPDKSTGSTTTTPVLSPLQLQTAKDRTVITQGAKDIADKQYTAGVAMDAAKAKADADKGAAQERVLDQSQGDIDQWSQRLRTARERYDAAPLPSLFGDKTTGGKVLMGLGIALGALGSAGLAAANARLGHGAQAPDTVGDIVNGDLERQRQNIQLLSDREAMAKAGLSDAYAARKVLLADVDTRGAIAYSKLAEIVKANLASRGLGPRDIEKNQAYLDANKGAQEQQEKVVAGLTQTKTATSGEHNYADVVTKNENKPGNETTKIPSVITDSLSGSDLPVDPARTDQRKHNAATAKLPPINTFLDTADKLIGKADAGGAQTPEWASIVGSDTTGQAEMAAAVTRLRSAYAAAKGESVGEANSAHLAQAIPDPPSALASKATFNNWQTKIDAVREEMNRLRDEELANAGVPPAAIAAAKSPAWKAAHPEQAATEVKKVEASPAAPDWPRHVEPHIPAKSAKRDLSNPDDANAPNADRPLESEPARPVAPAVNPAVRAQAIELLKANPARQSTPKGKQTMQQFNITDEDLK